MILRVYWIFEIVSIIYCIHLLYGKRVRDIIHPIILISLDVILLAMIEYYQMPKSTTLLINVMIILYCLLEFGRNLRALLVNNILYIIILTTLQAIGVFIVALLPFKDEHEKYYILLINIFVLIITVVVLPKLQLRKFSVFIQRREKGIIGSLIVGTALAFLPMYQAKLKEYVDSDISLIIVSGAMVICYLCYQWQVNSYKKQLAIRYLNMHYLHNKAYEELLDDIRRKQHDYKNLINSILCQHFTCTNFQELVETQSAYCNIMLDEVKKQDIYDSGDSVLTAFLYGKILEAKEKGITVKCSGKIAFSNGPIAVINQIQILGNLIDNAIDALTNVDHKVIRLRAIEIEDRFGFEVKNVLISDEIIDIGKLAEKGYSTKGSNRGSGLHNVKCICDENGWTLKIDVDYVENHKWISFSVYMK